MPFRYGKDEKKKSKAGPVGGFYLRFLVPQRGVCVLGE